MAQHNLFVLKVPLNTSQPANQLLCLFFTRARLLFFGFCGVFLWLYCVVISTSASD